MRIFFWCFSCLMSFCVFLDEKKETKDVLFLKRPQTKPRFPPACSSSDQRKSSASDGEGDPKNEVGEQINQETIHLNSAVD